MQLRPDKTWPDEQTRRALIYVVVMCATIVAGLGAAVYGSDASFSEPQTMREYFWIIPIDGLPLDQAKAHPVARWLVILGEPLVFASVVLVLGFIALLQRDRRLAFIAIAGPISAEILTEIILKPVVGREAGIYYAYPSGHVTAVASLMAVFALMLRRSLRRIVCWIAAPFIAIYTAGSVAGVIILHMHDMTDAVGGLAIGIGVIAFWCVVALEWDGLKPEVAKPHEFQSSNGPDAEISGPTN